MASSGIDLDEERGTDYAGIFTDRENALCPGSDLCARDTQHTRNRQPLQKIDQRNRKHGYAGQLLQCAIEDARKQGRKGLVLTCKEKLIAYYAKFGFVNEGISESVHGNVTWYQMRYEF